MINLDLIGLFILFTGFIIGLGAVTVIDIHGFLGRKSTYWTEATIRTHKITKPMIWLGIILLIIGSFLFFRNETFFYTPICLLIIFILLIINGLFLSFKVSPYLLKKEKEGKAKEILPKSWQVKITISFIFSFITWWGLLFFITLKIFTKLN